MTEISGKIQHHDGSLWTFATLYVVAATDVVDNVVYPRQSLRFQADEQGFVSFELVAGDYALALGNEWYGFTVADADLSLSEIISIDNRIAVEAVEDLNLGVGAEGLATQEDVNQQIQTALAALPAGLTSQDVNQQIQTALAALPAGLNQQAVESIVKEILAKLPFMRKRTFTYETPDWHDSLEPFSDWSNVPWNLLDFQDDGEQVTVTVIEAELRMTQADVEFLIQKTLANRSLTRQEAEKMIRLALADIGNSGEGIAPLTTYDLGGQQLSEFRVTSNIEMSDNASGIHIASRVNDWTQIVLLIASAGNDFEVARGQAIEIIFKLNSHTKWLIGLAPADFDVSTLSGTAYDYTAIALYVAAYQTHYFYGSGNFRHSMTGQEIPAGNLYKARFEPRASGGIDITLYQVGEDFIESKKIIEGAALNAADASQRFYPCVIPGTDDLGAFELVAVRR